MSFDYLSLVFLSTHKFLRCNIFFEMGNWLKILSCTNVFFQRGWDTVVETAWTDKIERYQDCTIRSRIFQELCRLILHIFLIFSTYYTFLFPTIIPTFPIILTCKQDTKLLRIYFNYPTQGSKPKKKSYILLEYLHHATTMLK